MKYQLGLLDNLEDLEKYEVGGFHPLHIGDTLDGGRYRIVHKLGFGGFATVWLGRDQHLNRYVALKIIMAEFSNDCSDLKMLQHLEQSSSQHPGRRHVASLVDHFWIEGPNGSHVCLVSQVAGPPVSQLSQAQPQGKLVGDVAQKLALQATQGLAFLHSIGVGHGDFTPSNILVQLVNLDSWSEEEVYKRLGQAVKDEVYTMSGDPPGPSAPTYVVEAMSEIDVQYLTESILIIDFGQSFFLKSPPPDGVGTPMGYCAPEVIFDLKASAYSDIWALACTIFEIRAGQALFETFFSTQEEVIRQMVQTLGRLPGPWWHAWECRMDYFDENGKPKQEWENDIPLASLYPLIDHIKDIGEEDTNEHDVDQDSTEDAQKDGDKPDGLSRHEDKGLSATGRAKISSEEVTSMEDLLSKMLKYAPEERISAEQASEHPWFTETF